MQARDRCRSHLALALALALCAARAARADGERFWEATPERARFALEHDGMASRLRIALASLLPGAALELSARDRAGRPLAIDVSGSPALRRTSPSAWTLTAPRRPGWLELHVASPEAQDEIQLHVFVLVPRARLAHGRLNGYEIGRYPPTQLVQGVRVEPPAGFIELTARNQNTLVSPHFRLGQFACKESDSFPKYLLVDARLVAKLEALLDALHARGISAQSLAVMSGFRTPAYNRALGNPTRESRHLFGEAVDVFVDESPRDGRMDDLDGNGVVDERDAELLFALADGLDRAPGEDWFVGGASFYAATSAHGPFVHLDVRGHAARW